MATTKNGTVSGVPIQVNIQLHESAIGEKAPQAVAYAYTASGHFIVKAAVDGKGNATLSVPAVQSLRQIRIVAGPEIRGERQPTLSELTRRGAKEQFVRIEPESKVPLVTLAIPHEIWRCWLRLCFVEGRLLKRVLSGGLPADLPVCNAEIQIWEVEPIEIIIARLPDIEIEKLRRVIINPPAPEGSIVPVHPNPPDPAPFTRLATHAAHLEMAKPAVTQEVRTAHTSSALATLQFTARHANVSELRQALISNAAISRLFICELIPLFVTKTLVATTTTDRCGNFEALVFLSCFSRNLNLYFTATVNFFGAQIPIFNPVPVACHTHWNYQCGTHIMLYTDSILAHCCSPCAPVDAPENYVLFRAIGNIQLNAIYGASTILASSTTGTNIGQIADGAGAGLNAPFGSSSSSLPILPRIEFDSSLRDLGLAKYYQISYRSGTVGSFSPLIGQIDRHYNHFVGTVLATSVYNLGPKTINSLQLFEIPPSLPPDGDWAFPDPRLDLANAQFPSSNLPAPISGGTHGKYQLKLDLFDSAGNPVNIASAGIAYFVPTNIDPDGTIHTTNASTLGLVSGNSLVVTLHIDNRMTFGALDTPVLDGNLADTCGVFRYTSASDGPAGVVTIPYTATHPDNFATYSYRLSRGAVPLVPPTISGAVSAATNPTTVSTSAKGLLTEPDSSVCDVAGFAEDLYVAAMATNGWARLSEYDSSPPPRSFVLAPKT